MLDDADSSAISATMQTGIGHIRHDARREGEPVDARSVQFAALAASTSRAVGLEDVRLAFDEQCGECAQGLQFWPRTATESTRAAFLARCPICSI